MQKREKKQKTEENRGARKSHKEEIKEETYTTGEGSKRINLPKANSKEWESLDKDLTAVLNAQSSSPKSEATMHPVLIYYLLT